MSADLIHAGSTTPATIVLSGDYERDLRWGGELREAAESLQFMVGDWVLSMTNLYEGSQRTLVADLEKAVGIPANSLRRMSQVSKAIPAGERSATLSYTHHVRAAVAENPVKVLKQAEAEHLSVRDTERIAKGLPVGGEETAKAQSSTPAQGATLEEAAIEDIRTAALHLARALDTINKPGFRLTVPVGQGLTAGLKAAALPFRSIEERIKEEIGAFL